MSTSSLGQRSAQSSSSLTTRQQPSMLMRLSAETKHAFKTTEFWAMGGVIAAILIAAAVSDSLGDVRAWTLVTIVAAAYIISRGLAKAGSRYSGGEDPLNR